MYRHYALSSYALACALLTEDMGGARFSSAWYSLPLHFHYNKDRVPRVKDPRHHRGGAIYCTLHTMIYLSMILIHYSMLGPVHMRIPGGVLVGRQPVAAVDTL